MSQFQKLKIVTAFLAFLVFCSNATTITGVLPSEFLGITDNAIEVPPDKLFHLHVYGENLDKISDIAFATTKEESELYCETSRATESFKVYNSTSYSFEASVRLRKLTTFESAFYICLKSDQQITENNQSISWLYAVPSSSSALVVLRTASSIMPLWLQIIIIIILFFLSGLFSGLNLGLMALDKTELKIIETAGDPDEKRYAKAIRPIREKGNLLLCTILLGNVTVNTSLTILMDNLTGSGLYAVIASTLGITLFGEILPQAICSRHGLAIGAKTIWLTKFFLVLTFPIAFPISFILDKMLGDDLGQVYSKEKLGVLIKEQQNAGLVAPDEMNIIAGALTMSTKTVGDIMTPINDAFMLPNTATLDFDTMNEIFAHGFSRIPVYEGERKNIKAILNVKDLGFINADDKVPLATVCNFYNRSIVVVPETTSLEAMLKEFRQGKTHMAFVERLVTGGQGDPYREMIGLVTLEDIIEEIIQAEIVDETDIFTDNTRRQPRLVRKADFRVFNTSNSDRPRHFLSPQLKIAALRHLASNVAPFKDDFVALSVLQSLLNSNVVIHHVFSSRDDDDNIIYKSNHWANFAVLILQGRALVETSNEHLVFEAGPFMFFGETVLKYVNDIYPEVLNLKNPELQSAQLAARARFLPDYTVRAVTNIEYLRITAEHYLLARRLTVWVTQLHPHGLPVPEPHEEKLLCAVSGDTNTIPANNNDPNNLKKYSEKPLVDRKDSFCVSALQGESQDFFQTAWDRHVSHLREATRASVLASIVNIGGNGMYSSAPRPNSRVAGSPISTRQSIIDGISYNDSSCESYPGSPRPDSPRKHSEGGIVRIEVGTRPGIRLPLSAAPRLSEPGNAPTKDCSETT